ncbi:hypothetical protein QW180_05175 [Vibrio sinaloensis]|nr:hypothetical protein [Vibrio sinaloensis]
MGLERLVLMLETLELTDVRRSVDVYMVTAGEGTMLAGMKLAELLREQVPGLRVMNHFGGGSFKKQFKRADKVGAAVALVLGEKRSR